MTALQEAAMRKALEALETCSYGDYSAKHVVDPSFDGDAVEAAIESLKAALAQQGEQQPVCAGCGIPAGDVHMSTCQSGKWPSRVSKGDTDAPSQQQAQSLLASAVLAESDDDMELTDAQILTLWEETYVQRGWTGIEFARAIERAHGIGVKQ